MAVPQGEACDQGRVEQVLDQDGPRIGVLSKVLPEAKGKARSFHLADTEPPARGKTEPADAHTLEILFPRMARFEQARGDLDPFAVSHQLRGQPFGLAFRAPDQRAKLADHDQQLREHRVMFSLLEAAPIPAGHELSPWRLRASWWR
jgi:hypothetical protein